MKYSYFFIVFAFLSCSKNITTNKTWTPYDETSQIESFAIKENKRMRFKLIQSKNLDKNLIFKSIQNQIGNFKEKEVDEGLDADQRRAGQWGPTGGPAKIGNLVGEGQEDLDALKRLLGK